MCVSRSTRNLRRNTTVLVQTTNSPHGAGRFRFVGIGIFPRHIANCVQTLQFLRQSCTTQYKIRRDNISQMSMFIDRPKSYITRRSNVEGGNNTRERSLKKRIDSPKSNCTCSGLVPKRFRVFPPLVLDKRHVPSDFSTIENQVTSSFFILFPFSLHFVFLRYSLRDQVLCTCAWVFLHALTGM